jgi:hypothetical protein
MALGAGANDQRRDVGHDRLADLEVYLKFGPDHVLVVKA